MPSPRDHLQALEKELALLQTVLTANKHTVAGLNQACRDTRAEFDDMNKKHAQLTRAFENCRTDLWSASSRTDRKAAARAEERMGSVVEEQVKIQRRLPQMYRKLGEMVGARDSTRESIREYKDKVDRKVEEIHTLRPCQSLACAHCGRGSAAALQKVKVNLKDRVARILRAE
jgi:chromosome segregation ATPase